MAEQNQNSVTPVYLDRNIENIRILEKIMAEQKGITNLKGCVLAAIDFFVIQQNKSTAPESQENFTQINNKGQN